MKRLVLYFFLLVLHIPLNLILNIVQKRDRFSKAFLEKSLKLIPSGGNNPVTFDPGLMLLLAKIDPIPEE